MLEIPHAVEWVPLLIEDDGAKTEDWAMVVTMEEAVFAAAVVSRVGVADDRK